MIVIWKVVQNFLNQFEPFLHLSQITCAHKTKFLQKD